MIWKPIDFEGVITIDKSLYQQLDQFLNEKESQLGESIIYSLDSPNEEKIKTSIKLPEALEVFEKRVRQSILDPNSKLSVQTLNDAVITLNKAFWQYIEVLENSSIELFQQLGQLGIEKWHRNLSSSVSAIKMMLMHRMEDVSWAIKRIESLLWKYERNCQGSSLHVKKWLPWARLLDRQLLSNLEKSQKFLSFKYKKFNDRITEYHRLQAKIANSINQFRGFHVYHSLDSFDQENFKSIYQLLKIWKLNQNTKSLPSKDIANSIHQTQSEEKIYQVFNDYYNALKDILFHQARLFKLGPTDLWKESAGKALALKVVDGHRSELFVLGSIVSKYRDFILRTDPNPYVRSRLGFTEWVVGPEPFFSKRLKNLTYDIESLDNTYKRLRRSLESHSDISEEQKQLEEAAISIDRWLHEMSQPLASREIMLANANKIVAVLDELNELGSFNPNLVFFVNQTLSKVMRADWKYNVLFDIPQFFEVYNIHMSITSTLDDRQHLSRLNKFKQIIQKIQDWSDKKVTQRHIHEIEQDLSDIKTYLQEFLSFAQKVAAQKDSDYTKDQEVKKEISRQILEYRYLFGKFLHNLSQTNPDAQRYLQPQFLFIYQYLEAITPHHQGYAPWTTA